MKVRPRCWRDTLRCYSYLLVPTRHAVTITVHPIAGEAATSVPWDMISGDGLGFLNGAYERNTAGRHRRCLPGAEYEDSRDGDPRSDCDRKLVRHRSLPAFLICLALPF